MTQESATPPTEGIPARDPAEVEAAIAKPAAAWVVQLARTLKTSRLYDPGNPTVLRFRDELAGALTRLLEEHGPLTLRFTSDDVQCGETSLYPARSREDNIGLPFYRDGIRSIQFAVGIEPAEVDALVNALLQVTRHGAGEADLVSLLWDAELAHVKVDYVSLQADMEGGSGEEAEGPSGTSPMPWPRGEAAGAAPAGGGAAAPSASESAPAAPETEGRSDDWVSGEPTERIESVLDELEAQSGIETERLLAEHEAENAAGVLEGTLALVRECLDSGILEKDREELAAYAPRLLQEALANGAWREAREAARLSRLASGGDAGIVQLVEELRRPESVVTAAAVRAVDAQGVQGVQDFLALAHDLGPAAVEWLMTMLAESQHQRTRRPLARALAELCRDAPERLAPWLADPRWYVVRNVAHILGGIGGDATVGLLRAVAAHAEPRVRLEVITALAQADPAAARPVLLGMLEGADTRVACAVLHQLCATRDPEVARLLLAQILAPDFHERPAEVKRSLYSALAGAGSDEVLPGLEQELTRTKWFSSVAEAHRVAVARIIARIGTPAARELLERAAASRQRAVSVAARAALGSAS